MIEISKKDIWWSYFAHFFNVAAGIIVLPLILRMLSSAEIGLYYLMMAIASLVILFDFGFAPQFARNITYIFSGAQKLKKEGVEVEKAPGTINFDLLAAIIHTAKLVYRRLAIIVLITLLLFGTAYVYVVTDGFSRVQNSALIWVIFSISIFFDIYFKYFSSLLLGKGLVQEARKAIVFSKLTYIFLVAALLHAGLGLLSVVLAKLIAPFVERSLSYRYFFNRNLKEKINKIPVSKEKKIELFKIVWFNSKKIGLVFIGTYAITKLSLFLAGLYLPLSEVASYGLMLQLVEIISGISATLFMVYQPRFSSLRVEGNNQFLIRDFAFSMNVLYIIYTCGALVLIFFGQSMLSLIGSNTVLPPSWILAIYTFVIFLRRNSSCFASIIASRNDIPFVKPSLITGSVIAAANYLSLEYTATGILGLILIQGIAETAYSNWKWPNVVCNEFNLSFLSFLKTGFSESVNRMNTFIRYRKKARIISNKI